MSFPSALCAAVLLIGPAAASAQPAAGWTEVVLPGGRAGLLPPLGLRPDLPRALVVGAIVRTVHASLDPADPAHTALAAYLANPPEGGEMVPIPLAADLWQQLLPRPVPDRRLLGAMLADRNLALLCYGLLALDAETLTWLGARPDLLRRIRDRYAGVFAAFGSSVEIRAGALVLPGGPPMQPVWAALGVSSRDAADALEALLRIDEGRLAYFAATLDGTDSARLQFLTGDSSLSQDRRESLVRATYATFRAVDPRRRVNEFPFSRPAWDAALLATSIRVNAYGHLFGPRALWRTVLVPRTAGDEVATSGPDLAAPDAGWLLEQVVPLHRQERQERFQAIFYVQRQQLRHPGASWQELAALARAFRRYPALMLTLERMDVRDVSLQTGAAAKATALSRLGGAPTARDLALALFQAPLALLDTLRQCGAIQPRVAESLLRALLAIEPGPGQARGVAVWIETGLLPAIGYDPSMAGVPLESMLLEALAGFNADGPETAPDVVEWEGGSYRIDLAAPELIRLADIRSQQGGNTLDSALDFVRAGGALDSAATLESVHDVAARLTVLRGTLLPVQASELPGIAPPASVAAAIEGALEELATVRRAGDLTGAHAAARRLAPVEDAVLADVLTSIVYALALGPADSRLFLAGNVARRHDYGSRERGVEAARTPWVLPSEESGGGAPWHVRGSLLALDVGLAHLQMRPTRMDLPDGQPSFSGMDRRVIASTLALMDPLAPDVEGARHLVDWLQAGRRVLAEPLSPPAVDAMAERLALGRRRRAALAWTAAAEPAVVPELLLLSEVALLGRPAGGRAPAGWGMAQTTFTGCLCQEMPDPPALHRYRGRPAAGLLPSRSPELTLAVLEGLRDLGLPVTLAHGVLQGASYDFFHDTRLAHPDDWWSYSTGARTLPRERLIDYVSALTAGGPLVPTTPPAGSPQ